MQVSEAISSRRSIKQFDADHRLSAAEIEYLYRHARLAPTSFNIQHSRFIRITDPQLRARIRPLAFDQPQVTDAAELVVISADVQAWQKAPQRYWHHAGSEKAAMIVDSLLAFYRDREWLQRDEAIRSGAFAAQNLMLTARELGYDSCPMIGFDIEAVGRLIGLPDDHVVVMMLALGRAAGPAWERGGDLPASEVIFENGFMQQLAASTATVAAA
ncbi:MAG: nitroreductase family protein [Zoogloeaceae bacterium]|nr:nitroreductase family protein [Zoogloeaceae bacterium]